MRCTSTYWDMILAVTIQNIQSDFPVFISCQLRLLKDLCCAGDTQRCIKHPVDQEVNTSPF